MEMISSEKTLQNKQLRHIRWISKNDGGKMVVDVIFLERVENLVIRQKKETGRYLDI